MKQFAGLEFEERWYWAGHQRSSRFEPFSAVTHLIQGVYEKYPSRARAMLRSRILSTEIVDPLDVGMVKVSAKRISLVSISEWEKEKQKRNSEEIIFNELVNRSVRLEGPLSSRDRAVRAEIYDAHGSLIESAENINGVNRTLHAEVLCLQNYWKKHQNPLPIGAVLKTSLSPCKQCAAMLWTISYEGKNVRVEYEHLDPGKMNENYFRNKKTETA